LFGAVGSIFRRRQCRRPSSLPVCISRHAARFSSMLRPRRADAVPSMRSCNARYKSQKPSTPVAKCPPQRPQHSVFTFTRHTCHWCISESTSTGRQACCGACPGKQKALPKHPAARRAPSRCLARVARSSTAPAGGRPCAAGRAAAPRASAPAACRRRTGAPRAAGAPPGRPAAGSSRSCVSRAGRPRPAPPRPPGCCPRTRPSPARARSAWMVHGAALAAR